MTASEPIGASELRPEGPLRVAVLVKQVPLIENLELGPEGRLRREGVDLEMNPYCRRAVTKGTQLATVSAGSCIVFTLGPPSAEDVLREAVAWGADRGIHLCDVAFAGSDSLATARALAAAIQLEGPFDLVISGLNSTDGETGQVPAEVAELLDLPFAAGVRELDIEGHRLRLRLEQDDGWEDVEATLPIVLSTAERLCEPCKVDPEGRRAVSSETITVLTSRSLGPGPWGDAGSPTKVGPVRLLPHDRVGRVLTGDLGSQVVEAVSALRARGALEHSPGIATRTEPRTVPPTTNGTAHAPTRPGVVVVLEPDRANVGAELLGAARALADDMDARVVAWQLGLADVGAAAGADEVVELLPRGSAQLAAEDVAGALSGWARREAPWAILAPSTAWGREVAARTAASLGAGLIGDAIGIERVQGELVAAKPAFSGALVADISCTSAVQLVTVRPGVLPAVQAQARNVHRTGMVIDGRGRVRTLGRGRDDDVEELARAEVVIGVGAGVLPGEYEQLAPLAEVLGAKLAATRKVTDKGWAPHSRQVGTTGRSIAPRLYVAVALSGKFNHVVGVRGAGTVLAVNDDPSAPVFAHADVGIVGDWHEVVPMLEAELRTVTRDSAVLGLVTS